MPRIITPQALIAQLAECLYPGHTIKVKGYRSSRGAGGKKPPYTAQLFLDGKVIMSAQERDWRKAYKTLQINLSKGNIV
jgi:hypothetical protein